MTSAPNTPATDCRAKLRERVHAWFTDRLMMELALLLIPATVLPLVLPFSPIMCRVFDAVNYGVIAAFAAEYVLKLYAAESRWQFFRSPWHLLDLLILVLAACDFLPFAQVKAGKASPLLRLLRLARFFAVTGRAFSRVAPSVRAAAQRAVDARAQINILEEGSVQRRVSWVEAVASVVDPHETWIDVQQVTRADLDDLSKTFRVPRHVLESKLFGDSFPGIDYFKDYTLLVLWDTRVVCADGDVNRCQTENTNVVVICTKDYLATLSVGPNTLFDHLAEEGLRLAEESFSVRVLYAILQHKIEDYKSTVQMLERRVADMEELHGGRTRDPNFLDSTAHLKKLIQKQDYNLRHFVQVLHQISMRKVVLQSIRDESLDLFVLLRDEAEMLNDTCHSTRENLVSLIELQLNRVSFDINRVMRVVAVLSCISLAPAIIGGLLGENLVDQPFNVTIYEIFFLVISLMLIALYVFYRKGWLK